MCEYIDNGGGKYSFGPESAGAQSESAEPEAANGINWFNGVWIKQGDKPGAGVSAYYIEILNNTTMRFGQVDSAAGTPFLPSGHEDDNSYTMQTVERAFTYDAKTNTILCSDYPTANSHGGGYPPLKLCAYPGASDEDDRLGLTWNPKDNSRVRNIFIWKPCDQTLRAFLMAIVINNHIKPPCEKRGGEKRYST